MLKIFLISQIVLAQVSSQDFNKINVKTIASKNANENINVSPNGTGKLVFTGETPDTLPYFDSAGKLKSSVVTATQIGYLANATANICGISQACTLTNQTIDADANTLSNIENADIKAAAAIAHNKMAALTASRVVVTDGSGFVSVSGTTTTVLGYLDVSSSLVGLLDLKAPLANPAFTGTATGDFSGTFDGSFTGDIVGNADTATALESNPSDCGANTFANTIAANGNLTCAAVGDAALSSSYILADGSRGLSGNWNAGSHTITATTFSGALSGNATTATSLAANPADCGAGEFATTIAASGALACEAIEASDVPTLNQNTTGSAAKWTTARNLAGNSVDGSANVAFANAFIVQGTSDAGLSGAQFLGALATGIVKNTTSTGVLSIAVAGDFPTLNQNTTGTAAALTNNPSDCGSNTYATTIAANGNLTCASITNAATTGVATATADTLVLRDGSGNFAAATITAALTGNASTATELASDPSACGAGDFVTDIDADGTLTCDTPASGAGDITSVVAGAGLSGGGTTGDVTIDLENPVVANLTGNVTGALTGNASTATALAANGGNCSAGSAPIGVDASGAVESCTDYEEDLSNSAGLASALSDETGSGGVVVFNSSPSITSPSVTTLAASDTVTVTKSIGATSTDGIVSVNTTAATVGAQKWSPRIRLTGQGWKTQATAASQTVDWIIENQPVQAVANPETNLVVSYQADGGGYIKIGQFMSTDQFAVADGDLATPAFTFISDPNTGFYRTGADQMAFVTGGTEGLTIDNAQNVRVNSGAMVLAAESAAVQADASYVYLKSPDGTARVQCGQSGVDNSCYFGGYSTDSTVNWRFRNSSSVAKADITALGAYTMGEIVGIYYATSGSSQTCTTTCQGADATNGFNGSSGICVSAFSSAKAASTCATSAANNHCLCAGAR